MGFILYSIVIMCLIVYAPKQVCNVPHGPFFFSQPWLFIRKLPRNILNISFLGATSKIDSVTLGLGSWDSLIQGWLSTSFQVENLFTSLPGFSHATDYFPFFWRDSAPRGMRQLQLCVTHHSWTVPFTLILGLPTIVLAT